MSVRPTPNSTTTSPALHETAQQCETKLSTLYKKTLTTQGFDTASAQQNHTYQAIKPFVPKV